jgi:cell division protein FtsB
MMERSYTDSYRMQREPSRSEGISLEKSQLLHFKKKIKWRFKPRPVGKLFAWSLMIFIIGRMTVLPLLDGICNYFTKTKELAELQRRYQAQRQQMAVLKKNQNYMRTNAYVEEKGHQIGMIKPNESQMVVVDSSGGTLKADRPSKAQAKLYED